MNDILCMIIGACIALIIIVTYGGPYHLARNDMFLHGNQVCEVNGGLKYVRLNRKQYVIHCENGVILEVQYKPLAN